MLPELAADALHLFVFGPGTGELIVVCAPPGRWLVVDGCGHAGTVYASAVLTHYSASPDLVVLTHPHADHYKGLDVVVEQATMGDPAAWPLLGLAMPPEADGRTGAVGDLATYLSEGGAEHVVATILERWERAPKTKWTLQPGSTQPLGEAQVKVLSPTVAMRSAAAQAQNAGTRFDLNQLSAVLVIEWRGLRVVLGADLVETPGAGWSSACDIEPELAAHVALKVPHHGSVSALHEAVLARTLGPAFPNWIVTPKASDDLPNLEPGGGADRLLAHVESFEATALPRAHDQQSGLAERYSLDELRPDGRHLVFDPPTCGFPDGFVVVTFPPGGTPVVHHGPGSMQITR